MPAPIALAPFAWKAAQLGAVAAISYYAARRQRGHQQPGPRDVWRETALNDMDEGLETDASHGADGGRLSVAGKFKRGIRLGADGPGIEVEFATLTRFKFRKI